MTERKLPADQADRTRILEDLNTTMLVEAAAGTGKTTSMVGRMINLLARGVCTADTMAAVTFTRKAAAELRSRFQADLEKAFRNATGVSKKRLAQGLSSVDRCFIGTIHSFCARLLRERPVEAGVDVAFTELDDVEDELIQKQAWDLYVARLHAEGDPILEELDELGLEIGSLVATFHRFASYPDVEEWPAATVVLPELSPYREALDEMVRRTERVLPELPENVGSDKLIPKYRRLPLMARHIRPGSIADFMEVLAECTSVDKPTFKYWPMSKDDALAECGAWNHFCGTFAQPLTKLWLEKRYEPVLRAVKPAVELYDGLRRKSAALNYQDLLLLAARLLRDKPRVREYFRRRFTHLLVDEFQDTDPIQAEVMLLLTATDPVEARWRHCRPVDGSLFVVGDPKQSIYRFRRADIVTYNQVREIIAKVGRIVTLSVNFRTTRPLVEWVNRVFDEEFPDKATDYSPAYVPLVPMKDDDGSLQLSGLRQLRVPEDYRVNAFVTQYEADVIARTIRGCLDSAVRAAAGTGEAASDVGAPPSPGDFMIVTPRKGNLAVYAGKLEELGVPHQVTGGSALNLVDELTLLGQCLSAVIEPDNTVALVSVLRSGLFGISDADLFRFKRMGGRFSYRMPLPANLAPEAAAAFEDAFARLRTHSFWLSTLPPVPAVERIVGDLGLMARAAARPGGSVQAGSFAKALELLREDCSSMATTSELVERLTELVGREEAFDGIAARADDTDVVRVMNLHKVKGLEARVVFLADPTGENQFGLDLHVDRSGERVRGYLKITAEPQGRGPARVLAQPAGWGEFERIEGNFRDGEKKRLLYVASTRAAAGLVITQRAKDNRRNPWSFFAEPLEGASILPDPGPQEPPVTRDLEVSPQDCSLGIQRIRERWSPVLEPTFQTAAAKAVSISHPNLPSSGGEHSTEWGTAVHTVLQAAMLDPAADLLALAEAALDEQGLECSRGGEAVGAVAAVMGSLVWKRAIAAQHVLVEVPFEMRVPLKGEPDSQGKALLRGVIDLAFRESDGWVIVDYKTDRRAPDQLAALAEHYRPQIETYVSAWQSITGEGVHEAGLFFTHSATYWKIL
ncbi:MAG: UvrD-helicase domain-containing protein [Desulfomonile tiedjei]|nr:UvrD-helicase domain-containing protein [Desulfomonile tiedjei]